MTMPKQTPKNNAELLTMLIAAYSTALTELKALKSTEQAYKYIEEQHLQHGFCNYCIEQWGIVAELKEIAPDYLFPTPYKCFHEQEKFMISIENRLKWLQKAKVGDIYM